MNMPPVIPAVMPGGWTAARRAMGGYAGGSGGKGGGNKQLRNAGRRYVQAKGGATRAARAATGGRAATARLGGFLSDVARRGITEAARALGLADVVGRPVETVLAAIADALAPDGATLEEVAARRAIDDSLATIFEQYGVDDAGVEQLNALGAEGTRKAIELSVTGYIYQRWLQELGQRIEERAIDASSAVQLERDVKAYVTDIVKLDLKDRDPLTINWDQTEGQEIIQRIYREAYSLLGV
jgi:hypothetical protein